MDRAIRNKMLLKPALLALAALFLALFIVYFVPYQLSKIASSVSNSEQPISLPAYYAYIVIFIFTIKPLVKLAENFVLIKKWQKGTLPSCPVCQHPMQQRLAKRGSYTGQRFWGCMQYPKCGGTIHIG